MIHLNDNGLVDPDVFRSLDDDQRAALEKFRRVQVNHARNEHWRHYHAPARRNQIRGAA